MLNFFTVIHFNGMQWSNLYNILYCNQTFYSSNYVFFCSRFRTWMLIQVLVRIVVSLKTVWQTEHCFKFLIKGAHGINTSSLLRGDLCFPAVYSMEHNKKQIIKLISEGIVMRGCMNFQAQGDTDMDITKVAVSSAQEHSTMLICELLTC